VQRGSLLNFMVAVGEKWKMETTVKRAGSVVM